MGITGVESVLVLSCMISKELSCLEAMLDIQVWGQAWGIICSLFRFPRVQDVWFGQYTCCRKYGFAHAFVVQCRCVAADMHGYLVYICTAVGALTDDESVQLETQMGQNSDLELRDIARAKS